MKILWVPQISSMSSEGKVLLNKDSNIAVLRNLIGTEFCNNNDVWIAIEFSQSNCVIDKEMENNFHIIYDESRRFTNAYMERFCFNSKFFNTLSVLNFDVIFVNEPTKVIPLKKIFNESKIVAYNN